MRKTHTQCTLQRGTVQQHAWIPSEFAVKGKFVKLLGEDGWEILSVGDTKDSAYVRTHEVDYKRAFPSIEG